MDRRQNFRRDNRQPAWKKNRKPANEHKIAPLEVEVRDNDVEQAVRILEKKIAKEGILGELRKRRFAEKPSEAKRRKRREAERKARKSASAKKKAQNYYKKKNDARQKKDGDTGAK